VYELWLEILLDNKAKILLIIYWMIESVKLGEGERIGGVKGLLVPRNLSSTPVSAPDEE